MDIKIIQDFITDVSIQMNITRDEAIRKLVNALQCLPVEKEFIEKINSLRQLCMGNK